MDLIKVQTMNDAKDKGISLKLLKLLKDNPELTQRQMNKEMGVSLGKINFCISDFVFNRIATETAAETLLFS